MGMILQSCTISDLNENILSTYSINQSINQSQFYVRFLIRRRCQGRPDRCKGPRIKPSGHEYTTRMEVQNVAKRSKIRLGSLYIFRILWGVCFWKEVGLKIFPKSWKTSTETKFRWQLFPYSLGSRNEGAFAEIRWKFWSFKKVSLRISKIFGWFIWIYYFS